MNQQNTLQGPGRLSAVIKLFSGYSGFNLCSWVKSIYERLTTESVTPGVHAVCCFQDRSASLKALSPGLVSKLFDFHPAVLFQKDEYVSK